MLVLYFRFLTHHNLQGSQTQHLHDSMMLGFLTHHNLQGSQTTVLDGTDKDRFLTHHNLQGSQTLSVAIISTLVVSYPS